MTASSRTRSKSGASGADAFGHLLADPVAELAPPRGEDLVEQIVPADRLDGGQQAGRQGVVVRREEVLGIGGHVVQVARPADAVADRLAADEAGRLERPKLLEHAGPAGADPFGELVRRSWVRRVEGAATGRGAGSTGPCWEAGQEPAATGSLAASRAAGNDVGSLIRSG